MMTTNLFTHPVFKDGALHEQRPRGPPLRAAQGHAQPRPRRRARRAAPTCSGAAARAPRPTPPRTSRAALERYREALDLLAAYVLDQRLRPAVRARAEAERAARRHPAADRRARARLHRDARAHDMVGRQPRGRPRADVQPQLRPRRRAGAVAGQALPHRPQRAARAEVRPGPRLRPRRPARAPSTLVDLLETAPAATTARATSTTSRCAPRTSTASGCRRRRTCARTCCSRERAAAFRADPEVQEALAAARVAELAEPDARRRRVVGDAARGPLGVRGLRRRRGRRARLRLRPAQPARARAPARRALRYRLASCRRRSWPTSACSSTAGRSSRSRGASSTPRTRTRAARGRGSPMARPPTWTPRSRRPGGPSRVSGARPPASSAPR